MSEQKNNYFIDFNEVFSFAPYIARYTNLETRFCLGYISCKEFSHWTFELLSEAVAYASSCTAFGAFSKLVLSQYNKAVSETAEREN